MARPVDITLLRLCIARVMLENEDERQAVPLFAATRPVKYSADDEDMIGELIIRVRIVYNGQKRDFEDGKKPDKPDWETVRNAELDTYVKKHALSAERRNLFSSVISTYILLNRYTPTDKIMFSVREHRFAAQYLTGTSSGKTLADHPL